VCGLCGVGSGLKLRGESGRDLLGVDRGDVGNDLLASDRGEVGLLG